MRVGIIGLGDIAQKAYLPVLAATPGLTLRLMTRDRAKLDRVGAAYRVADRFTDLDELVAGGLDAAFVHATTAAHVPIVERLLTARVPVFVDKPLDYRYGSARRLVELAERADVSLFVGFNRRYAPAYRALLELPRTVVVMQKNRVRLPAPAREMVFDDFIHVADTLRFLAPAGAPVEPAHVDVRYRTRAGLVHSVVLQVAGPEFTAVGVMNRVSGSTEETLEVLGDDVKRRVVNLADVVDHVPGGGAGEERLTRRGDWTPMPEQRGFAAMCGEFLGAVRAGRVVSARDALRTHELCELVVGRIEAGS